MSNTLTPEEFMDSHWPNHKMPQPIKDQWLELIEAYHKAKVENKINYYKQCMGSLSISKTRKQRFLVMIRELENLIK